MSIELGYSPESLRVTLVRDADFVTTLTNQDGDWSSTATIELRFDDEDDTVWAAEIDGPVATFDFDKLVSNAIPRTVRRVNLWYVDAPADLCWAKGTVVFK